MPSELNAGQKSELKYRPKNSLKKVTNCKYLGKSVTNQNRKYEEIKYNLNSEKLRYHFVQKIFSSHLTKI
jgi:hypothetical protein